MWREVKIKFDINIKKVDIKRVVGDKSYLDICLKGEIGRAHV